jgi:methylated-DNA-protein-cysteine methyltransferase-like protein
MRFSSPPNPKFYNAQVWEMVQKIPAGKVSTYGKIASFVPVPLGVDPADYKAWGARWVGGAMAACPEGIPWQRVINSEGKVSLSSGSGGQRQRELLEAEGVVFDDRGRVNLQIYAWQGPLPQE